MRTSRIVRLAVPLILIGAVLPAGPAAAVPAPRYQAETATISQGVVASNYSGFTGTGYVDTTDTVGSYVEWSVFGGCGGVRTGPRRSDRRSAGAHAASGCLIAPVIAKLSFRFANGTGTDRTADISLNGTVIGDEVSFAGTGGWTSWQNRVITATLVPGANTIRVTSTTANGTANLDALDVDTTGVLPGGTPQPPVDLAAGLTLPWALSFFPDGLSALVTERDSFRVSRLTQSGVRTTVGSVPNTVTTGGEGGLLGIAVSPKWNGTTDQQVFFLHTSNDGGVTQNRIIRMNYNGTRLAGRTVLLAGIRSNTVHNGGQLKFGPDGLLYATTGDAQNTSLPQNITSLSGKILRLTRTGAAAPGNPFGTHVYSYGHRNPQGLAWDSAGRLWSSEFGASTTDELNLILPGHNYGWPTCEGACDTIGLDDPKRTWPTSEASPSSLAIVNNVAYVAALRGARVWRVELDGNSAGTTTSYLNDTLGRIRAVVRVPGAKALWLSTSNGTDDRIVRSDLR